MNRRNLFTGVLGGLAGILVPKVFAKPAVLDADAGFGPDAIAGVMLRELQLIARPIPVIRNGKECGHTHAVGVSLDDGWWCVWRTSFDPSATCSYCQSISRGDFYIIRDDSGPATVYKRVGLYGSLLVTTATGRFR